MQKAILDLKVIVPNLNFNHMDVLKTFNKLDLDHSGTISYSEFLYSTLSPEILNDETLLAALFNDFDSLSEGFVTKQSILIALKRKGLEISSEIIDEGLQTHGYDETSKITRD